MTTPKKAPVQPPAKGWRAAKTIWTRCVECGGPWIEHSNAIGRNYYDALGHLRNCPKFVRKVSP